MGLTDRGEAADAGVVVVERTDAVPPAAPTTPPRPGVRARHLLAVGAVLVVVAGAIGWWSRGDGETRVATGPASAGPSTEATPPRSEDPDPPGAVARHAREVALDPAGPYADGQVVAVSVPDGFAADLLNNSPAVARQCAVLADGPGGPGEWCDTVERAVLGTATGSSVQVRLDRVVFTPTGDRDCEDPAVTCRLVLQSAGGADVASGVLRFRGDPLPRASLDLRGTGTPGELVLTAAGVEPHPSWQALRASDPARAAGFGPFWLQVCAFGPTDPAMDPWGADPWGVAPLGAGAMGRHGGPSVPPPNCDAHHPVATIDPDDPSAPTAATVPTHVLGYGGWSDCRADRCFVQVRRTIVHGFGPGGALLGSDEVVATALVPAALVDPDGRRPELRVLTPGPHGPGQELEVRVTGVWSGRPTNIGVCQEGHPWSCGYLGESMGRIVDGTHVIRLPEQLTCAARCYLALDSQGEGVPPLATAPLDLRS